MTDILPIRSRDGDYAVHFCAVTDAVREAVALPRAIVLIDGRVADLYRDPLWSLLDRHPALPLDANERTKTLDGCADVLGRFHDLRVDRATRAIAIGGGTIQDVATFCAQVWHRGIAWEFWPTTLLAQADSCIGAKAGINLGGAKNQLGVFHAPAAVRVCPEFRATLASQDVASGIGEIAKMLLVGDVGRENVRALVGRWIRRGVDEHEGIRPSLNIKRAFIEEDEREHGRRVLLNYGHTFGHALEALTPVPHGLAVAWGMAVADFLAYRAGRVNSRRFREVRDIARLLRADHGALTGAALVEAARTDKKAAGGTVTLVVPGPDGMGTMPVRLDDSLAADLDVFLRDEDPWRNRNE